MTPDEYTSIAAAVECETEISRSRFVCLLSPVGDETAARERIARARALHPRARHHCTAFVVGPGAEVERSNDDGEPSGTAGAPMLEALRGAGVSDVVAVVVRYFGGVLLGTGGLTRAYRGAVSGALALAAPVVRQRRLRFDVRTGYAPAAAVEAEARRRGWQVESTYGARVELRIAVGREDVAALRACVERATAGRASPVAAGEAWVSRAGDRRSAWPPPDPSPSPRARP
jgi:uncharacterized YigZ family protein